MTTIADQKAELRRAIVAKILAIDPNVRAAQERDLLETFPALPSFAAASRVLLYVSAFPEEIDTKPYLDFCLNAGKMLLLPRVDWASRTLSVHHVTSLEDDLQRGRKGLVEPRKSTLAVDPNQVDWVLVPGLAFDGHGRRLGRGAGHYDRLIPRLRADVIKLAVLLNEQWVDELPTEAHDVPLDVVASSSKMVFRAGFQSP